MAERMVLAGEWLSAKLGVDRSTALRMLRKRGVEIGIATKRRRQPSGQLAIVISEADADRLVSEINRDVVK